MKKLFIAATLLLSSQVVLAGTSFSFSIGTGQPIQQHRYIPYGHTYQQPQSFFYSAPNIYYESYRNQPVIIYSNPQPIYYGNGNRNGWKHNHHNNRHNYKSYR